MKPTIKWLVGWTMALLALWLLLGLTARPARAEWRDASEARVALHLLGRLDGGGLDRDSQGAGLSLDLDAYRSENFGVRGTLGYFQLESLRDGGPFSAPYVSDLDVMYVAFGPILRGRAGRLSPYLDGGAGLYLANFGGLFEFEVNGGGSARVALDGGSVNLGLHAGAGLDLDVGGGFALGAELRYTNILAEGDNLGLVGLHLGLDYRFE